VVVLLGIVSGFPTEAVDLFEALMITDASGWWEFIDGLRPTERGWDDLVERLQGLRREPRLSSIEPFRKWAPRVGRFSFETGRWAAGRGAIVDSDTHSVGGEHPT
jgi:hypothetical protein